MDINLLREATTIVSFLTFLGILFYALNPGNRERFERDALSVLDDDDGGRAFKDHHPDPLASGREPSSDAVSSKDAARK